MRTWGETRRRCRRRTEVGIAYAIAALFVLVPLAYIIPLTTTTEDTTMSAMTPYPRTYRIVSLLLLDGSVIQTRERWAIRETSGGARHATAVSIEEAGRGGFLVTYPDRDTEGRRYVRVRDTIVGAVEYVEEDE